MSTNRLNDIMQQLDELTVELGEMANGERAQRCIKDLRTTMGFAEGGYVGQTNICELVDDGEFTQPEDDEDDE